MRLDVDDLDQFPTQGAIEIPVDLVRRLSPDTSSVTEFRCELDMQIAVRMLQSPLLGQDVKDRWKPVLYNEFHMTNDSEVFETSPRDERLPLYEGKMIWHFTHQYNEPRYWVSERKGRKSLLGRSKDEGGIMDYQQYRFAYRAITGNTNERTFVCTILPKNVFFGHSLNGLSRTKSNITDAEMLFFQAVMSSFVVDFALRQRVATQLTMFYVYQIPVPRLTEKDSAFSPIMERAARLICTTPEFTDLAKAVGLKSHRDGATDPVGRAKLRAELDGLIAHLYGLTEEEYAHVLSTFPLVSDPVKVAAKNAYRDVERGLVR